MKKYYLLCMMLFAACINSGFAQTISSQKGLTTAVFNLPAGIIKVYLPDDIRPGDMISGSVLAEPSGKTAKQTAKNLAELKKYTVEFNGQKIPVVEAATSFQCNIDKSIQPQRTLNLMNGNGENAGHVNIQTVSNTKTATAPAKCKIPTHALTAAPLKINGPFDGNSSNTNCTVGNQPLPVLAESPRQCQVAYPENATGNQNVQVQEKNQPKCSQQVSGVELNVSAGKLNLLKGEKTFLKVAITGLKNLRDTAVLSLVNTTPDIVVMQPSNVFQTLLVPDSVKSGVFIKTFDVQSIKSGNFSVNVNLELSDIMADMPENYPNPFLNSCDCKLGVALVKRTTSNPRPTFAAVIQKGCIGQDCQELNLDKKWELFSGKENADIVDIRDNKSVVTLQPKQAGTFILKFSATLGCTGGKTCTAVKYCNEKGEEVEGPQVETENNGETETPGKETSSRCACNASCNITRGEPKNQQVIYTGTIKAACTGTSGSGTSRSVCSTGPITYQWKIGVSGKDVAEITGKNDEASVTVKEKKEGNYTLYLSGLVTCSDGTFCEFVCNWEQTVPPPGSTRACMPSLTHDIGPLLNGGLLNYFRGAKNTKLIRRDDFIGLEAAGTDVDLAILDCKKLYECPDAGCNKQIPITGRVRFEWTVLPGKGELGSLVQIGCIPDEKTAKGEHVIFKPPFIPLPVTMKDTTVVTEIDLAVIDDGSAVTDPTLNKTITIKTTRKTTNPDFYEVEISGAEYKPSAKTIASNPGCACKPIGPDWTPGNNLIKPDIILPKASATKNKIVLGQWMILTTTDQRDKDLAAYKCQSTSSCPVGNISTEYEDIVLWNWTVKGGGEIVMSNDGQYVIYAAPLDLPKGVDSVDITITLKVYNPGGRADPEKSSVTEKVIRVYRPGIKLSYPPKSWLPEDTNHVSIKSELVYRSGKGWLPALDHMCRILYFELMDISHEKGVCMNEPVLDKADECFDLQLQPGNNLEAFAAPDPVKEKCTLTDQYMQARTTRPVKEHDIELRSMDFGAYGFLRSFANINYGIVITKDKGIVTVTDKGRDKASESPLYYSVPWLKEEVQHPVFNERGKKKEYTDNRVTLPYDADENHIADVGWKTTDDVEVDDPPFVLNVKPTEKELKDARRKEIDLFPENDSENLPLGDGFRGDGLGSYEEYRGFRVKMGDELKQVRTDPKVKDIFVYNPDKFSLKLYKSVSGLNVYEINEDQFGGTELRVVNFNNSPSTHIIDQKGLYLVEGIKGGTLLGIALTDNGKPAIPNYVNKVVIYRDKVAEISTKFGLNPEDKLGAVVAHELLHANNVCHHGEGNEAVELSHDVLQGLRSGDIYCVMHYDNSGNRRDKNYIPEPTGTKLCTSDAGTGYNLPKNNTGNKEDGHLYFGETAEGKGSCAFQIRISGRGDRPTSCGNRYDSKNELKKQFKKKKGK